MYSKWLLKAVVQKVISFLPYPNRINYLFQKYVTKGVYLDDAYFELKLQHAKDHYEFCQKYINSNPENRILELGTGWYPIIPIYFYLTDSGNVTSIDIQDWIRRENILLTIEKFVSWNLDGKLKKYMAKLNYGKLGKLKQILNDANEYSLEKITDEIGLSCEIQDARFLKFKDNCFDFICSNNTLEHIKKEHLKPIFLEFKRIMKSDGLMSHFIDLSDHFAHFDRNITIYNFLKYSSKRWKIIDNSIQHQNRLRFVDYKMIFQDIGIPVTEEVTRNGDIEELNQVTVNMKFLNYSKEELAISHGYLVSNFAKG